MDSDTLTNEHVIEHVKIHGVDKTTKYMLNKCQSNVSYKAMLGAVTRAYQKYHHLNKSKGRTKGRQNLDRFFNDKFIIPPCDDSNNTVVSSWSAPSDDPYVKAEAYQSVAMKLADDLNTSTQECAAIGEELNISLHEKNRLNESLERKESKLGNQRKLLKRTANREAYWREKPES